MTPGLTSTFYYSSANCTPLSQIPRPTRRPPVFPYSTNGQTRTWRWTWTGTGQLQLHQKPRTDVTAKTSFGYAGGVLTSVTDALSHIPLRRDL